VTIGSKLNKIHDAFGMLPTQGGRGPSTPSAQGSAVPEHLPAFHVELPTQPQNALQATQSPGPHRPPGGRTSSTALAIHPSPRSHSRPSFLPVVSETSPGLGVRTEVARAPSFDPFTPAKASIARKRPRPSLDPQGIPTMFHVEPAPSAPSCRGTTVDASGRLQGVLGENRAPNAEDPPRKHTGDSRRSHTTRTTPQDLPTPVLLVPTRPWKLGIP